MNQPKIKNSSSVHFSEVIAKPVRFIWGRRIAIGKLNIIAGDGGDGKTTVACDLASRLSRGEALPGDSDGQRLASLIVTAEDGDGDTVRHRIEGMGGDLDRVFVPSDMFDSFHSDVADLRAAVSRQPDLKVLFFDTLPDFIGETTDDHKNSSVRQALKPIIAMAGELDVAIVGICHFRKGGGDGKSGDRLLGSVAYRNLPRSVLYVLKDPDNEAQRIVWHEKHNLSPQAPALSFRMQPHENSISIAWDADPIYIDDISRYLKAKSKRSTKADEAKAWLTTILPAGTAKPRDEIIAAARAAGFHEKTLYRAADGIAKDKATGLWHNNQQQEVESFRF